MLGMLNDKCHILSKNAMFMILVSNFGADVDLEVSTYEYVHTQETRKLISMGKENE